MGEKPRNTNKEKIPHLVTLLPPVYEMEADCVPVPEKTENKPGLH